MRQQENRAADGRAPVSSLDAIRLEQFLALQQDLLLAARDPDTMPERLVQWVGVFLGVRGAVVCVIDDDRYRVLGAYGVGPGYRRRYDGVQLAATEVAPALGGGRPLALADLDGDTPVTTLVLPFRLGEAAGALHVVIGEHASLPPADLELARALAGLAGVALANARLASLAHLKDDALATMAHDLRSPLNALVGYASLLAEGAFGPLSGEQLDIATTLERQALDLVDLLGATLDVARLETGRLPLRVEEFLLADVVDTLRGGTFARPSGEGRIRWSLPSDLPRLRTDRVKVREIVQNLVDNALKHGAGGGVDVEATAVPDRSLVRLIVRDSGPGIAPDVLPRLFEPFRAGSAPSSGTGFGLYIVRRFAEALGGRVVARAAAGEGTAITVELPVDVPTR